VGFSVCNNNSRAVWRFGTACFPGGPILVSGLLPGISNRLGVGVEDDRQAGQDEGEGAQVDVDQGQGLTAGALAHPAGGSPDDQLVTGRTGLQGRNWGGPIRCRIVLRIILGRPSLALLLAGVLQTLVNSQKHFTGSRELHIKILGKSNKL